MKHYHKAIYVDGKLTDECAKCGRSWRDTDIHISSTPVNIVQQSLSGSEAKASTPKCQSCGGDVKIESQETTYVCDKCFNRTYD